MRRGLGLVLDHQINKNFYGIYTLTDLQNIQNDLSADYVLMNNIDASATSGWNGGLGFNPIGTQLARFTGNFDGQGYTISNLFINRPLEDYVSLFGGTGGTCMIKDLHLTGVDITGQNYVGGFIGNPDGVLNYIQDCSVTGVVDGNEMVGGFVGHGCTSKFYRDWTDVSVTGVNNVGGFTGSSGQYFDCYSIGNVNGTNNEGGFNGYTGAMTRCYSTGQVNGGVDVGKGFSNSPCAATVCFWDTQTSGQATSPVQAVGKTTAQMKAQVTFTDWNFDVIWEIVEGVSYPTLQ